MLLENSKPFICMKIDRVVALLQKRDEKGLSYLYDNYSATLNGIIVRIVGSEKIAEEVLQQTFLKIWDKIDLYDASKATLFTWMARIARNSAIDVRKLSKYKNAQVTDSWEGKHNDLQKIVMDGSAIDVKTLLDKMNPKYRAVLDCVYLNGYSQNEASDLLDIPLGTIKTRVRMGINELRIILKSERTLFVGIILFMLSLTLWLCQ